MSALHSPCYERGQRSCQWDGATLDAGTRRIAYAGPQRRMSRGFQSGDAPRSWVPRSPAGHMPSCPLHFRDGVAQCGDEESVGGSMNGRKMVRGAALLVGLGVAPVTRQSGDPWRVVSDPKFSTVVAYDTTRVTPLPRGRADVWERFSLHPPRSDPDGLVGSIVMRVVIDCSAQQTALRSVARHKPSGELISQTATFSASENDFSDESPGSVEASALHGICASLHHSSP
jgi:hypothetical protein